MRLRRMRALRRSVALLDLAIVAPLLLLAFLTEDEFADIFHALALVGLGAAEGADFGGDLADLTLVDARDGDFRRLGRYDRHARRNRIDHIMAEAKRQLQIFARDRGSIADAVDLELLFEALGHADD